MFPELPHNDFELFNCISTMNYYNQTIHGELNSSNTIGYYVSDYFPSPITNYFNFVYNPVLSTFSKIDEFLSLNPNWDGYNSIPVTKQAGTNTKNLVSSLNDLLIENIADIFPNPHGTITIQWKNHIEEKISLEIGSNSYSYFVINPNKTPKFVDGKDIFSDIGEITTEIKNVFREKNA